MGYGLWVMGYGLWVMGYGLWVMGYGLWVMGYGLWVMGYARVSVQVWSTTSPPHSSTHPVTLLTPDPGMDIGCDLINQALA